FSNLGNPDSSSNAAIGYNSITSFNVIYAQGFTTGTSLYDLNSVDLPLAVTGAGNGSPLLQIYSNNAGNPGTALNATFTN
ncbi:choice-of-anchor R domain-containing protein, partial [Klebsiella pneumoniae]|uniref:choice-of-anchor R domain-containing protein n=1 Tax=Klebsiella pneumoniae TaxID=573 RepID=UPI003B9851D4